MIYGRTPEEFDFLVTLFGAYIEHVKFLTELSDLTNGDQMYPPDGMDACFEAMLGIPDDKRGNPTVMDAYYTGILGQVEETTEQFVTRMLKLAEELAEGKIPDDDIPDRSENIGFSLN